MRTSSQEFYSLKTRLTARLSTAKYNFSPFQDINSSTEKYMDGLSTRSNKHEKHTTQRTYTLPPQTNKPHRHALLYTYLLTTMIPTSTMRPFCTHCSFFPHFTTRHIMIYHRILFPFPLLVFSQELLTTAAVSSGRYCCDKANTRAAESNSQIDCISCLEQKMDRTSVGHRSQTNEEV